MGGQNFEELVRSPIHARLLRFLCASEGAVQERFLTPAEREVALELERLRLIRRSGERIAVARDHPDLQTVIDLLLGGEHQEPGVSAEQEEFRELLTFIQQLTGSLSGSNSVADLFDAAFSGLIHTVDFDIGVSVMLEQNLDVYLSRRENLVKVLDERLIDTIRASLQTQIPVSFTTTDAVVQSDLPNLPARETGADPLAHHIGTILSQDNRTAGILALYRADVPFTEEEQRMLEVLSAHVSMVLGNIKAQEQIQNLADTDDLTGIWNRRAFRAKLPGEIERAKVYRFPLTLLMLDVDNFKQINDTSGHVLGDVVLSEICGSIRESLRTPDTFSRFGGDEFAIILPHTDLWGARAVADRILQKVRSLRITGDAESEIPCSVSIGIAAYVPPEMTSADLIQRADDRLLAAKKAGKDRYSY
ncbi:MAG TPA: sensor domain-containing diguanylate cyclase [Thermoanaerobaculia bacterium]|nr:sensor domain-containing diguanylate cyclase [Thermoanaerobaculia bacterium]